MRLPALAPGAPVNSTVPSYASDASTAFIMSCSESILMAAVSLRHFLAANKRLTCHSGKGWCAPGPYSVLAQTPLSHMQHPVQPGAWRARRLCQVLRNNPCAFADSAGACSASAAGGPWCRYHAHQLPFYQVLLGQQECADKLV